MVSDRPASWLRDSVVLALVVWVILRSLVGLDYTDEFKYYGQIYWLAQTGLYPPRGQKSLSNFYFA
jgi:hypothetical protein